jgi:hypothetical protein
MIHSMVSYCSYFFFLKYFIYHTSLPCTYVWGLFKHFSNWPKHILFQRFPRVSIRISYNTTISAYSHSVSAHRSPSVSAILHVFHLALLKVHVVLKRQRSPTGGDIAYHLSRSHITYRITILPRALQKIRTLSAAGWECIRDQFALPSSPSFASRTRFQQTSHMSSNDG